jgi:hypothetical protein
MTRLTQLGRTNSTARHKRCLEYRAAYAAFYSAKTIPVMVMDMDVE